MIISNILIKIVTIVTVTDQPLTDSTLTAEV